MKISHLTSVHPRIDTRIFHKMCSSLAANGFTVSLVVADGLGDNERNNVHIYDVGKFRGRFNRICSAPQRVFKKAISLDADLYQLHDPELIPIGLKLKKLGKIVIFDAHEDLPKQMLTKPYLNRPTRWFLSRLLAFYESRISGKFDAIVTATPAIRDKYFQFNTNVVDINNFPLLGELASFTAWRDKKSQICYIGGISAIRGAREIIRAMEHVKSSARLQLAGRFTAPEFEGEVKSYPGWTRVDAHGFVNRDEVRKILEESVAGIVSFHPVPNHLDAQPNKMFEYMSAGIPVIASHFPLWKEIILGNQCGICVDPLQPKEIAAAIDFLVSNPDEAESMGTKGRAAVEERYTWSTEGKKMINLYNQLLAEND